jgi:hypothetical protein
MLQAQFAVDAGKFIQGSATTRALLLLEAQQILQRHAATATYLPCG